MPIPSRRDTIYLHRGDAGKVRIGVTRDGKTVTAVELAAHVEYTHRLRRERDYEVTKRERAEKEASYQAERAEHFRRRLIELEPDLDWANRLAKEP